MLARPPDGGQPSHKAVMSRSTPTGLFRFISSMASTARCLGVPNATRTPSTLISNDPSRPNSRRLSTMAPIVIRSAGRVKYPARQGDQFCDCESGLGPIKTGSCSGGEHHEVVAGRPRLDEERHRDLLVAAVGVAAVVEVHDAPGGVDTGHDHPVVRVRLPLSSLVSIGRCQIISALRLTITLWPPPRSCSSDSMVAGMPLGASSVVSLHLALMP